MGRPVPLVRAARDDARDARAAGARACRAAAAVAAAVGSPRRRPHPRRGAPATGRDHPGHARPDDQPGHRRAARASPAPAAARLGVHGRRVRRVRQHDADDRVERPLRSGGGAGRPSRPGRRRSTTIRPSRGRSGWGSNVTERAQIGTDEVVRLARRAGSTPDDSLALGRGEDPMHPVHSVASDPIVRYLADALRFYFEFHAKLRRVLRRVHPRPAGRGRGARPLARADHGPGRRRRDAPAS